MSQLSQYVGFYNIEPTVDQTPASLHLSHQLVEQLVSSRTTGLRLGWLDGQNVLMQPWLKIL